MDRFSLLGGAILLGVMAGNPTHAADQGSICIGPAPFVTPGDKSTAGQPKHEAYTVVVDERAPVPVLSKNSLKVPLPLDGAHTVRVLHEGKSAAELRFTFAEAGASDLCLWFDVGEDEWKLDPVEEARGKCGCAPDSEASEG